MSSYEILEDGVEHLLTPGEVAAIFRVDVKTVARWERDGRLTCVRTLGNHRRFRESVIRALLNGAPAGDAEAAEPGAGEA